MATDLTEEQREAIHAAVKRILMPLIEGVLTEKLSQVAVVMRTELAMPAPDAAAPDLKAKYEELIYAVGNKYPGESRHETALRYIRRAEQASSEPGQTINGLRLAEGEETKNG